MKVTFLIGLPGSGKSTLGRKMAQSENVVLLDDIKDIKLAEKAFAENRDIIVADVSFCMNSVLIQAENILKSMNPCTFEYIYFENAPDKCRKNVEFRMEQGDTRKVFGAIELFSEQYKIPENIVPLKVYEAT